MYCTELQRWNTGGCESTVCIFLLGQSAYTLYFQVSPVAFENSILSLEDLFRKCSRIFIATLIMISTMLNVDGQWQWFLSNHSL